MKCEICNEAEANCIAKSPTGEKRHGCQPCFETKLDAWMETQYDFVVCPGCGDMVWHGINSPPKNKVCPKCRDNQRTCKECQKVFFSKEPMLCCSAACLDVLFEKEMQERASRFWRGIPIKYKDSVPSKILDQVGLKRILEWDEVGQAWLFVWGESGAGKTRSIYMKCRELVRTYSVVVLDASEFKNEVVARTKPRDESEDFPGSLKEYMDRLSDDGSVVWFDEFDKITFSPRVGEEFFGLIDYRYKEKLPTIFSCVSDLDKIAEKLPYSDQITRRILDSAREVHLLFPETIQPSTESK